MTNWLNGTWPSWGIQFDTGGAQHMLRMAAMEEGPSSDDPTLTVQVRNTLPYHNQSDLAPAHGSIVTTTTPTLSAPALTDPNGSQVQYWFRVGTLPDAETGGQTINSGWLNSPTFTPPKGSLQDGVTYYWKIFTRDPHTTLTPTYSSWPPATLKVDLRLGESGPSPYDAMGPVQVNLATGNATITVASPSFDAVSGPIGTTFTYNSGSPGDIGLMGTYVDSTDTRNRVVRQDPNLDFYWNGSPAPGVPNDYFTVNWRGYVKVPTAGSWQFGAVHDDAVKIQLGSPLATVLDRGGVDTSVVWGSAVNFGTNEKKVISVDHTEEHSPAHMQLWASGPGFTGIVPSDWFSVSDSPLPSRWHMSTAGASGLTYSKAVLSEAEIVLHEPSGAVHKYTKQGDGTTWKPTNVDDDVVTSSVENGARFFNVEAGDGITYTFDGTGTLTRAVSSLDDKAAAAPSYGYDTTTGRLTTVTDPVSARAMTLTYAPAAGGAGSCPTTGFSTPPAGMLCKLAYPDGSSSTLFYDSFGRLVRIEDPGTERTDFAYDSSGRVEKLRDALAYDAVNAVAPNNRADDDTTRTVLTYDGAGRTSSVTLAKALATDTTRPTRTYRYVSGTETQVDIAGLTPPTGQGFARKVTYDQSGRLVTDTGLDGLTSSQEWELAADRMLSAVDTTGRKSTTIYDHAGRPTDVYGPAPAAWFGTNRLPLAGNVSQVPRKVTAYDEGLRGLAAAYWDNETFAGPAKVHALGVGDVGGALNGQWAAGSPAGLGVVDNWASRFTGDIAFPSSGYKVETCGDNGSRVWIDDVQVVDGWTTNGCVASTWTSPGGAPQRIRVEHRETTLNTKIELWWISPGGTRSIVPGSALSPRWGLATSSTDADGKKTATEYAAPETGLATKTVVDPAGIRLSTETGYEAPGVGYRQRTTRQLPGLTYDGEVRPDNPAAYWRLGEVAGPTATDASGNGRHATYQGTPVLGRSGATGTDPAVDFDYTGATAGDVLDFAGTAAFSMDAWVRPAATGTGWQRIISKEATDAAGRQGWLLWTEGNRFGFERIRDGAIDTVTGGATIAGQWTHVAARYTGTTMYLYVNGTQVGSTASTRLLADTTGSLKIGEYFKGRIDEAAVYTGALDPYRFTMHWRSANRALYSASLDATGGYWRLTEDTGPTARDHSGNNRHATYAATGVSYAQPGRVAPDNAVSVDGGSVADAGDILDFTGTAVFAAEAWVKPSVNDATTRRILSKEATDAAGRQGWTVWLKDGKVGFERVRDGVADKIEGATLTPGRWHHVFARFNGGMKIYVDGVEVASMSSSTKSLLDTTATLKIGDGYKGSMTHAAVYTVAPGSGAILRHYQDGIAPRNTGTVYYQPTETRTNPCPGGISAVQSGMARVVQQVDPDGTSGGVGSSEESVYDVMGRVVASRTNNEAWTCTVYDNRGRMSSKTVPAFGGEPARTISYAYSVGGDPLVASTTDVAGTVTIRSDLLGRVVSYTDVWGKVTTTAYDQAGRVTTTVGPAGTLGTTYLSNGRIDAQTHGAPAVIVADPAYDAAGQLSGVSYPTAAGGGNGTALAIVRDTASGRVTKLTWSQAGGALLASDEVAYSVGGLVRDQKVDGVDHHAGDDFWYDTASRLITAYTPGHFSTYDFARAGNCGSLHTAGLNTNRTFATVDNGPGTTYCYDNNDKLTSTNDARYPTVAYDTRGNTTTLGTETMVYDGADRHVQTTKGTTVVRYVRDVADRIVERKVNGVTAARYSYSAGGDSGDATLDALGNVVEKTVLLLGGVLLTIRATGAVWSYPNVHGDIMATANAAGAKQGATLHYDAFGQPWVGLPDNSAGNLDYGWLGQHQRPVETEAGLATIEMGARPYVPGLGRFLTTDPIEGGSANDYDYVAGDPVNSFDLDGLKRCGLSPRCHAGETIKKAAKAKHLAVNIAAGAATAFIVAGCIGTGVCGAAMLATGIAAVTVGAMGAHNAVASRSERRSGRNQLRWFAGTIRAQVQGATCGVVLKSGCLKLLTKPRASLRTFRGAF